jgi:hypothetical protein
MHCCAAACLRNRTAGGVDHRCIESLEIAVEFSELRGMGTVCVT